MYEVYKEGWITPFVYFNYSELSYIEKVKAAEDACFYFSEDMVRGMYKEDAEKRVKLRLALETIAKKENIEVTEADLDEEYGKIAETYKMDVEKVKESVPADSLSEDVKVQKALNLVKDNANIK